VSIIQRGHDYRRRMINAVAMQIGNGECGLITEGNYACFALEPARLSRVICLCVGAEGQFGGAHLKLQERPRPS